MLKKAFFYKNHFAVFSLFLSFSLGFLLSCAPIQLDYDLEAQFTNHVIDSQQETSLFDNVEEEEPQNIDYSLNFITRLSNTLYENSSCSCNNNDDCTRGCSKQKGTCTGRKAINKVTKYCMRHVTGSIMDTMDVYCKKMNKDTPKNQCLEEIKEIQENQDSKNNICRQSLFYPSALCVLNLDGQNRITPQTIKSRSVRNNCRYYNTYNGNLRYFYSKIDNEYQQLPLFIEVPIEKPETLPFGTIIVLESSNPNGHVEVKTNKKICDGDYCFCSDFCVSRKGDWKSPYKPLVAFRWNPLFINHLDQWDEKQFLDELYY